MYCVTKRDAERLMNRAERYSKLSEHFLQVAREFPTEENLHKAEKTLEDSIAALFIANLAIENAK